MIQKWAAKKCKQQSRYMSVLMLTHVNYCHVVCKCLHMGSTLIP